MEIQSRMISKWENNVPLHKYKGDHELTIHQNNAASDNPQNVIQILRFEKRAHGNMLWWHFDNCTYYKLPTTYLALSQIEVL